MTSPPMMHQLELDVALLYWIPSLAVIIVMVSVLCYSFWNYHRKNEKRRKSQRDYVEMGLRHKRPRIGALSCYTHAPSVDLMQSFSSSAMSGALKYFGRMEPQLAKLDSVQEEEDNSFHVGNRSFQDVGQFLPPLSWNDRALAHVRDLTTCEDTLHDLTSQLPPKRTKHSIDYDDYDLNREIKKNQERKRRRKKKRRSFFASNRPDISVIETEVYFAPKESLPPLPLSYINTDSLPTKPTVLSEPTNKPVLQPTAAWVGRPTDLQRLPVRENVLISDLRRLPVRENVLMSHENQSMELSEILHSSQRRETVPLPGPSNDLQMTSVLRGSHGTSKYQPERRSSEEKVFWIYTDDVAQSSI